jgi:hypothetical protein
MAALAFLIGKTASIPLPTWPKTYRLSGRWRIPYQRINQPFTVYSDYINNRQAVDVYNGLQRNIWDIKGAGRFVQIQPNIDHESCIYGELNESQGAKITEYLPTNNDEYKYLGPDVVLGRKVHAWEKIVKMPVHDWFYRFYADYETLEPVQFWNHGASVRGSHPVDYFFDIYEFGTKISEEAFTYPTKCLKSDEVGPTSDFGYKSAKKDPLSKHCPTREVEYSGDLPANFTWRDIVHVVPMPRDQANCGSCWAEGAAVSISSIISMKLNKSTQISVQQIVDCAWDDTNHACQGGNSDLAFRLLVNRSIKLALEEDYPYIGVGGYCAKETASKVAILTDCWQVLPENADQLKKALYLNGPLAVAIAADHPFQLWQGPEPYRGPDKLEELNHVVTLTGWKTVKDNIVWEIQNSWSDVWGMDGYGYLDGSDYIHDIGVTQEVYVPVIELLH